MMNTKNLVIGLLVVGVLVFGTLYYLAQSKVSALEALGAAGAGQTHFQAENFLQGLFGGTTGQFRVRNDGSTVTKGLVQGGTVLSLATTTAPYYLSGSEVCGVGLISATSTTKQANMMVVFPAATSTAASCLLSNGDSTSLRVYNSYVTSTVQFSADKAISRGVSINRTPATSTMILAPGESATIRFTRFSAAQMVIDFIRGTASMGLSADGN